MLSLVLLACTTPTPTSTDAATPTDPQTPPPTETVDTGDTDVQDTDVPPPTTEPGVRTDFDNTEAWCATIDTHTTYAVGSPESGTYVRSYTPDGREVGFYYPDEDASIVRTFLPGSWRWNARVTRYGGAILRTEAWTWSGHSGFADDDGLYEHVGTVDGRLLRSVEDTDTYRSTNDVTYVTPDGWRIATEVRVDQRPHQRTTYTHTWTWTGDEASIAIERVDVDLDASGAPIASTQFTSHVVETRTYTSDGQLLTAQRPTVAIGNGSWLGLDRVDTYEQDWRRATSTQEVLDVGDGIHSESVSTYSWAACD